MVFSGTDEMGSVLTRSNGCDGKVGVIGGLPEDPKSIRSELGCMSFIEMVVEGPVEDFSNSRAVPKFDGQPVNAEPSASSPLLVFGIFDMFCHHQMLGKNCFFPLSELGSDSKDDEIFLLDWVNPTRSGKDEDGGNALDCVPLAK